MPLINGPGYRPGWLYRNAHVSTIIPSTFRRVPAPPYARQRLELPDDDFLDLDWCRTGSKRVAVLCHGLEGNASRPYMRGMVQALTHAGWDAAAMNFRGCSGSVNRLPRNYHSGATEDLHQVLKAVQNEGYDEMALVGFSLGGNLVLKYLGENPAAVAPAVSAAVTVSVPVDLADTATALVQPRNAIYHGRFMGKLRRKIREKARFLGDENYAAPLVEVRNIVDFDEHFTGPLHGFAGSADYYARNSSQNWLPDIRVPTLLLTSRNDPILGSRCFPRDAATASPWFHLEETTWGGHVGFHQPGSPYYSEQRTVNFLKEKCRG